MLNCGDRSCSHVPHPCLASLATQSASSPPASSCRPAQVVHSLSDHFNHFPPPRHPDPDWTCCTPGIDLAWLGLAALTWFGPKLLAWPRHPAPRPPSAPTGGGGGLPFLLHFLPLPPHADKGSAKGKPLNATKAGPMGRSSEGRVHALDNVSDFLFTQREREERKVQPPYLAANASSAPPQAEGTTPKC